MINKYVYAVSKKLPKNMKDDVEKELRSNIDDMLGGDYSNESISEVLKQLGPPNDLADEYCKTKKYIIPPYLYDEYISFLQKSTIVYVGFFAILHLLGALIDFTHQIFSIDVLIDLMIITIEGIATVFFGVTVMYALIGRNRDTNINTDSEWTPEKLEEIPTTKRVSRREAIYDVTILGIVFYMFVFNPNIIRTSEGMVPLFIDILPVHTLSIILASALGFLLFALKLKIGTWNTKLAVLNATHNLILLGVAISFFFIGPPVPSPQFEIIVNNIFGSEANPILYNGIMIAAAVVILYSLVVMYKPFKTVKD